MRKTKIICTIGPTSSRPETLLRLIESGMDVARLNFSHGTPKEHGQVIRRIRRLSKQLGKNVAILQDIAGPKIRVGVIRDGSVTLKSGDRVVLTSRPVLGTDGEIPVTYPSLPNEVKARDTLLLADGALELLVVRTKPPDITCRVIIGGKLTSHKGINLPARTLDLHPLTDKDRADLHFGIDQGVDLVALSFVRRAADILPVREIMKKANTVLPIIAKIEKHEALDHIDQILDDVDGIMIARGDLGIEMPLETIPMVQKRLIRKAIQVGKPVITATQMLRSMVDSPRPTRAEATDIANAIFDGTDAIMLSEETASGNYPVESVQMMTKIAEITEQEFPHTSFQPHESFSTEGIADAISLAACFLARQVSAKIIVTPTESGATARLVSRYKPSHPIVALSPNPATVRNLALTWGVYPLLVSRFRSTDDMLSKAERAAREMQTVKTGDRIVLTAGLPIGSPGNTNMLKVLTIT
jgi:pyruvate kinase